MNSFKGILNRFWEILTNISRIFVCLTNENYEKRTNHGLLTKSLFSADLKLPLILKIAIKTMVKFCLFYKDFYAIFANGHSFEIQGISHWTVLYELALTDKNVQVKSCLKVVLESWDDKFLTESRMSMKNLDFWWFIQPKGASISHFGARDNPTISTRKFFSEIGILRL